MWIDEQELCLQIDVLLSPSFCKACSHFFLHKPWNLFYNSEDYISNLWLSDEPLYLCIVYIIQLAELWPTGVMDSLGIKKAIFRAKDRRRASYGDEKVWTHFNN